MGAMTPPSRKSCYNFRVTKIVKVLDGDTIDVLIDIGFDLYKKERVRIAGVDTPEKRTRDLEEKALGIEYDNAWPKASGDGTIRTPYVLETTTSTNVPKDLRISRSSSKSFFLVPPSYAHA